MPLYKRAAWGLAACLAMLAWPARAQVRLGELSTSMTGTIAPGYSATYGNQTSSTHNWNLGGAANFSGSYHNPNFLSFDVGLYLNQSRANSNYQSISNASGVNASATIFGGSEYPGAVNFSKAYNSEGNYSLPGISNYVTHGDSDSFGVTWSENIPDKPSLSVGFETGSSQYSVYGSTGMGKNSFDALNLHSSYRLAGFNMGAFYAKGGDHSSIPQVISGELEPETHTSTDAYGFTVSHVLPLHGSISGGLNRSSWNSSFLGTNSNGTIDLLSATGAIHPWTRLSFSASANYSDNLSGQLVQSVLSAGGAPAGINSSQTSSSLDLLGTMGYAVSDNLQTALSVERRTQTYLGGTYGVTSYSASGNYVRTILGGNFNTSLLVTDNVTDQTGENTMGFSSMESYSNVIQGWHVTGSFGYAQNVQTLLITYMSSYYNYSGTARRAWGRLNFSAGATGARTALTQQAGTANSSESYNAGLGYGPWATLTGSYSRANGQAIATGAGLVQVPVPSPVLPSSLVSLFGGDSYGVAFSSTPVKRFVITASYAKSTSDTATNGFSSDNNNNQFNALVQYQYRKLSFTSGFARLEQGFSQSATPPQVISSYYFGASRWFKFF